ncbi:MAG: hypothetical protein HY716_05385 [Planctomycetes bacterium]|nr:hypothetical protein [Planctomycetota bacterium]
MEAHIQDEVISKGLRRIVLALQGLGHPPVVIGALAHQAWGAKREPGGIELLISSGETQRDLIFSAARGEGLQQAAEDPVRALPEQVTLHLRYTHAKLGISVGLTLFETVTPSQKQMFSRAQRGLVHQMKLRVATCEDLILLLADSRVPADREIVVGLLRANAGGIDAQYLKREAEAARIFDKVKSAWQEARQAM